jgi:O-Antigen ligase
LASIGYHPGGRGIRRVSRAIVAKRLKTPIQYPTTRVEQILLMMTVVLLPLQTHIPPIAGFSIMYIMFIILAGYIVFCRPYILAKTWPQPLFLAAYVMLIMASLIELSHPYPDIPEIVRVGQIFIGGMIIAALCRDRRAFQTAVYGYLIAGLSMATLLFLTLYGGLRGAVATDFREATLLRHRVFEENPLEANQNYMAFVTAQGALVALVLALTAKSTNRRVLFSGIALFCFVAAFLPLSRSGIVIVIATSAVVLVAYGIKRMWTLMLAAMLGIGMLIWVPEAVYSRMAFSTETNHGKMEARARLMMAAIDHFPEYALDGVGRGNFWGPWGRQSNFTKASGELRGPHNWYIAAAVYWGVIGFLTLSIVVYQAYRCLPRRCGANSLSLCLLGIAVSLFLYTFVTHVLANKVFSLGFGLLVAARLWLWPQGIVQTASNRPIAVRLPRRDRS